MSSIISAVAAKAITRDLVIGKPETIALRRFFGNAKREDRTMRDELARALKTHGPYPLDEKFNADSIKWFKKTHLRKDGKARQTPQTKRLTAAQIGTIQNLSGFLFVGMLTASDPYEDRNYPGHQKMIAYPIWRATANDGTWFDYYHVPWQNHYNNGDELTGTFITNDGTGSVY